MAEGFIKGFKQLPATLSERGAVVTIGAFDGLHVGHQRLLGDVIGEAKSRSLPSVAVTFEPLPREYFSRDSMPARLMSFREKFEALRELGIDYVLLIRFDDNMRSIPAPDFVTQLFIRGLNARHVIVGDDFRFGANAEGDFQLLKTMLEPTGATVASIDSQRVAGQRVSSSLIREKLESGELAEAAQLLGRRYSIKGRVFPGRQLGRQLNFPTANIQLRRRCTAMAGVYVVDVLVDKGELFDTKAQWLPAVANVGTRPTVARSEQVTLEVHLLDYDGDLYGKCLQVRFRKKLRDEQKFDSLDELKAQISLDTNEARAFFQQGSD